jgi:hypothetical protein
MPQEGATYRWSVVAWSVIIWTHAAEVNRALVAFLRGTLS